MPDETMTTETQGTDKAPIASILKTVRQRIGPSAQYDVFDNDLIMDINAAFSRLCQIGVGPETPYHITGEENTWDEFMTEGYQEEIKQYICLKVRMIFDTPQSSSMANAIQEQLNMLEWTLMETARFGY